MVKALISVCAFFALTACTTSGSYCQIAKPIRLSVETVDRLSDAEAEAVLSANEKGARLCGWKP